jgi:hypothetical protein
MKRLSLALAVLAIIGTRPASAQQDGLEEAKAQYAAAAYEDALTTLTRVSNTPAVSSRVELEQYRAFCLLALGKTAEAERAIAALVDADPIYVPSQNVASPKVLSIVADMRKKQLPIVARKLLDEGRVAFKEKDFPGAARSFEVLRRVLDDPSMKGRPEAEDLRVLADGFSALSVAVTAPAPPGSPRPDAPAPAAPAMLQPDMLIEAVALQQVAPVWTPPDAIAGAREYVGLIRVRIAADGRVKSSSIEKPTVASYDARLLQASRGWIYKPAMRNGEPVESEKVISYQLKPRK